MTWKAYMQSQPFTGADVEHWPSLGGTIYQLCAQQHDPLMYGSNIRESASRLANKVPLPRFDYDLKTNSVPTIVWISPDQRNDMHSVGDSSPWAIPNAALLPPAWIAEQSKWARPSWHGL